MSTFFSRLKQGSLRQPPAADNQQDRRKIIYDRLACPSCRCDLEVEDLERCPHCGAAHRCVAGVPVFLDPGQQYIDRRHVTDSTNPYSPKSLALIHAHPDSLILDFGAGNPSPPELFDNVVRLDFVHYGSGDVVAATRNIPFRDDTFDFVVSESVFEHVADPWHYARELHRVLKDGGQILLDTAFLQPVHGDPYHFFNMTLHGLEEVMKPFVKVRAGVEPYQSAGMTMNILTRTFLELISDEGARAELRRIIGSIEFTSYDRLIPPEQQAVMAAGIYFVGTKRGAPAK